MKFNKSTALSLLFFHASALGNADATKPRKFLFPKHHRKCRKSIALNLLFSFLFLFLFLFHCAKEGMPPGGPEDTTPPKVISVSPKPDSTGVDLNSKIEITFSERMLEDLTGGAVFISPFPKKPFDYKWHGKTLVLSASEPFLKDKTYVVTIGTDAQDLRRNHLVQSYTFAFSTGKNLDFGTISGEVWVKQKTAPMDTKSDFGKETGISVWAYSLSMDRLKVDPEKEKPDYVTQIDEKGKYSLNNLSLGKYRLFAVKDVNKDLLWSWESEAIGVTTEDVELTGQNKSKVFMDFIIDKIDKNQPKLLNCHILNKNLVKLEFDKEMEERSILDTSKFLITSVSNKKPLKILASFYYDSEIKTVFLFTEGTNPKEKYELRVLDAKDKTGNLLDTASSTCLFDGSEIPDTISSQIHAISPKDGATNIPLDAKIRLIFEQPPEHQGVESVFSLVDSNETRIIGKTEWSNQNTFIFSPDSLLSGKMKHKVKLLSEGIRNLFGTASMKDSIFTSSFVTLDPDTLGSVSGKVQLGEKGGSAPIVLSLRQLGQVELLYQITILQPGPFVFERILPGKYFMSGFIDLNRDANLTLGQPEPFSPMEPFAVYSDTIFVRSRWETEGIELRFH